MITVLNLDSNEISDKGARHISDALKINQVRQVL
jgi:hypothetical protein